MKRGEKASPARSAEVILVDDHPILLHVVSEILSAQPGITIRQTFDSAAKLLSWLEHHSADLLVLDMVLGHTDGLDLIHNVHCLRPELKILVFSMLDEREYAQRVLSAGAMGYVMKDEQTSVLLEGVSTVLQGGTYLSERASTHAVVHAILDPRRLSDREFSVFTMIGRGLSTREIAAALHVSHKTVEKHRENIRSKLGIPSTPRLISEAARWFYRSGGRATDLAVNQPAQ